MTNKKHLNYKQVASYYYVNEIPTDWELLPNIALFDERRIKNAVTEEVLSISKYKGIVKSSEFRNTKDRTSSNKSEYLLVKKNDLAYNTMLMWDGAVGYSEFQGIVSPAYTVLKPKQDINTKYFHYLFRSEFYSDYSKRFSYGINDFRLRLYYTYFKRMYSIVPPFDTQNKIAEYLDRKQKQANNFIRKQQKMIELLKEQKKAIINQAVTKGLNPNVKMKDSGIEWLGKIPEHWEVRKLKFLLKPNGLIRGPFGSALKTNSFVKKGYKVYEQKNAIYKDLTIGSAYIDKLKFNELKRFEVQINDFLMSCSGTIGKLHQVIENFGKGIINQAMMIMRVNNQIIPSFFVWLFESDYIKTTILDNSKGSAMKNLVGINEFKSLIIPLGNTDEQKEIVRFIKYKNSKIDLAISKAEEEITLSKEYLDSLIFNVVTGQICV